MKNELRIEIILVSKIHMVEEEALGGSPVRNAINIWIIIVVLRLS